jgi:hypothetical protein
MHYQLWALNTGNLIREHDTEAAALATARALVAEGWSVEDLGLRAEPDDGDPDNVDVLPPALYGSALADRFRATDREWSPSPARAPHPA